MGEINLVLSDISNTLQNLQKWASPHSAQKDLVHRFDKMYLLPEPYGTVLVVAPWNYPIGLLLEPLVGAIAAGLQHTLYIVYIKYVLLQYIILAWCNIVCTPSLYVRVLLSNIMLYFVIHVLLSNIMLLYIHLCQKCVMQSCDKILDTCVYT